MSINCAHCNGNFEVNNFGRRYDDEYEFYYCVKCPECGSLVEISASEVDRFNAEKKA